MRLVSGTVDASSDQYQSPDTETNVANHSDTTRTVMKMVSLVSNSDLEQLIVACADLTWDQVVLESDRLTRLSSTKSQIGPGRCSVMPGHRATTIITNITN